MNKDTKNIHIEKSIISKSFRKKLGAYQRKRKQEILNGNKEKVSNSLSACLTILCEEGHQTYSKNNVEYHQQSVTETDGRNINFKAPIATYNMICTVQGEIEDRNEESCSLGKVVVFLAELGLDNGINSRK